MGCSIAALVPKSQSSLQRHSRLVVRAVDRHSSVFLPSLLLVLVHNTFNERDRLHEWFGNFDEDLGLRV